MYPMTRSEPLEDDIPSLSFPDPNQTHGGHKDHKRGRQAFLLLAIALSAGVLAYLLTALIPASNGDAVLAFNASRNYAQTPFDVLDAHQICQHQTKETHGDRLLMSYVDLHSSRFEQNTGEYKIFLNAHIGGRDQYDEAIIHCHIDPNAHLISHYKTVFPTKASLMSRALSFFK